MLFKYIMSSIFIFLIVIITGIGVKLLHEESNQPLSMWYWVFSAILCYAATLAQFSVGVIKKMEGSIHISILIFIINIFMCFWGVYALYETVMYNINYSHQFLILYEVLVIGTPILTVLSGLFICYLF